MRFSFNKTMPSFILFLFSFILLVVIGSAWPNSQNELISNAVFFEKKRSGSSFSFISLVTDESRGDNGVDDVSYSIDKVLLNDENQFSTTLYSDRRYSYYYVSQLEGGYSPIRFFTGEANEIAFSALNAPGSDEESINYQHLGLKLLSSNISPASSDHPIFLSYSAGEYILQNLSLDSAENLVNTPLSAKTMMPFSKTIKSVSFSVAGIFSKESSALFEKKYGSFVLTNKKDRILYYGSKQADVCENVGGSISYCSLLNSLDKYSNSYKSNRKYYIQNGDAFTSDKMEKRISDISLYESKGVRGFLFSFGLLTMAIIIFLFILKEKTSPLPQKESVLCASSALLLVILLCLCVGSFSAGGIVINPLSISSGTLLYCGYFLILLIGLVDEGVKHHLNK